MSQTEEALTDKLIFSNTESVPLIMQSEAAECGVACLAMVAGFHGFETDMVSIRRRFSVSSQGVNMRQLVNIATRLHMSGRAVKLELEQLDQLQLPCVLHWNMNHFVVLVSVDDDKICINDPAQGQQTLSIEEFSKQFTGIALELVPTPDFEEGKDKRQLKLSHFWRRLVGLKRSLSTVFLLSIILQALVLIAPFYVQTVVDDVVLRADENMLLVLALGFGLLMTLQTVINWLRETVILHISSQLNIQIASNVFRHLIRLPLEYFEKRHIGDVYSRFGSVQKIRELLATGLVTAVIDGLMAIATLIAMMIYSVKLGFIVLGVVATYVLIRLVLFQPYRLLSEQNIIARAKNDTNFMESVRAIQTIKLFQKESERENIWQNLLARSMNAEIRINRWQITYTTLNRFLFGAENIVVIYVAALSVIAGDFSIGMLYAFLNYKSQFVERMDGLVVQLLEFKMLGMHMERLADIAFTPIDPSTDQQSALDIDLSEDGLIAGHIEVKNLCYRYGEADDYVIKDLSLVIEAGETVALVGESGAGKTTLVKLMMGLLSPSSGEILVDGVPIDRRQNYRQQIAGVMQDDQLLSGSISDNISCFDVEPLQSQIIHCAKMAAIHNDIGSMPMGYNTLVGDMGTSLSGGQKQRVVLARALYKSPQILFLDEATSHLDTQNESIVNQHVKELSITRVLVAHRPDTVASADRVISL